MEEISYSGDQPPKTRRLSRRVVVFLLIILAVLVLLGLVGFFATRKNQEQTTKTINLPSVTKEATKSPSPTSKETPTPTVSAKKSALKVEVQNGSGEAGVAATAADLLKTAGYNVVGTGNADNFDYDGVTIQIKSSQKNLLAGLKTDLSDKYTITDSSTDLSEDSSYDALVIVGK